MKTPSSTQRRLLSAVMIAIALASFVSGAVVRVFAAKNDLWFDEVWTLELLGERVHSFTDVFTNFKHSNNHHLVSLWMWLVGRNASALTYRLPSVVASIGTVVLAGLIGMRRSSIEACIAVILASWSYLLIHFGTEARGYSLAIFFALLAWYALQQLQTKRSWIWSTVFWAALVLGFLAHLEFAICFAGLFAWSLWRVARDRQTWRERVLELLALFAMPSVLMLAFYVVAVRGIRISGGPTYQLLPLLIKTVSYTMGGPASGAVAATVALLTVVAICVVLVRLIFEGDDRWVFCAVVIGAPLGLIAIQQPQQLYVRYFVISVSASLLLLSSGFATLLRRRVAGRAIGLTLLAIFVAGNVVNTVPLLRFGRGQYLAALRFIETHSDDRKVVITSDQDFRNEMLVNYYKQYLEQPDRTRYMDGRALREEYVRTNGSSLEAEWLILHRFDLREQPERVIDTYGNGYRLVTIYRYSDLSGWNWLLYHNVNRSP